MVACFCSPSLQEDWEFKARCILGYVSLSPKSKTKHKAPEMILQVMTLVQGEKRLTQAAGFRVFVLFWWEEEFETGSLWVSNSEILLPLPSEC